MPKKQHTAELALAQLAERIGAPKLAARLNIQPATLKRWARKGVPPTKRELVDGVYARSERSRKAAATRKRARELFAPIEVQPVETLPIESPELRAAEIETKRRELNSELGVLATSEQLMRRLETEFGIAQPALANTRERIIRVNRELKELPGPTIHEILANLNDTEIERRKHRLLEELGLGTMRELYTLWHYSNSPKFGGVSM